MKCPLENPLIPPTRNVVVRAREGLCRALKPSFVKAVWLAALGCSFVMIKYRTVSPQKLSSKKHGHHHRLAHRSRQTLLSKTRPAHLPSVAHSYVRGYGPATASSESELPSFLAPSKAREPKMVSRPLTASAAVQLKETPKKIVSPAPARPKTSVLAKRAAPAPVHKKVSVPAPHRVVRAKKVSKPTVILAKAPSVTPPAPAPIEEHVNALLETALATSGDEESGEVDIPSPLDQIVLGAFVEPSYSDDAHANPNLSPAQPDAQFALNTRFPREAVDLSIVGSIERNPFEALHATLAKLEENDPTEEDPLVAPTGGFASSSAPAAPEVAVAPAPTPAPEEKAPESAPKKEKPKTVQAPVSSGVAALSSAVDHLIGSTPAPSAPTRTPSPVEEIAKLKSNVEPEETPEPTPEPELVKSAPKASHNEEEFSGPVESVMPQVSEAPEAVTTQRLESSSRSLLNDSDTEPTLVTTPVVAAQLAPAPATRPSPPPATTQSLVPPPTQPAQTPKAPESPKAHQEARLEHSSVAPPTLQAPPSPRLEAPRPDVRKVGRITIVSPPRPVIAPKHSDGVELDDKLFGDLVISPELREWLDSPKIRGHVELYLHPVASRNPQDTIFTGYEYPSQRFQFDARRLRGSYRLIAGIFTADAPTAVAQIPYEKVLSADTIREKILFTLDKQQLDHWRQTAANAPSSSLVLSVTLFEGASGNPTSPRPVAGGHVRVLGFPEWGEFVSDAEGTLRIPNVPSRSELLIEADAPGFYPSYQVVPTFDSHVYAAVSLIERKKVEAISALPDTLVPPFAQSPELSVVLGRAFDPVARTPRAGEKVRLSCKSERALYFGALPNRDLRETASTGLFGWFNVPPTYCSLLRKSGGRAELVHVRPGAAQYVELGRGGAKSFLGKVTDPYSAQMPQAQVRLVGDTQSPLLTDLSGNFKIDDLDLPPGVFTLEVEAQGYPKTWQTFPWSTRERDVTHTLYMMEDGLLAASREKVDRLSLENGTGSLVGGAEASFFEHGNHCAYVQLLDSDGKTVSGIHGPFPLIGEHAPEKALCLTKSRPGFTFFNLPPGEYLLKWTDRHARPLRSHVVRVGIDRLTVSVN